MSISSRFSVAIHILALLEINKEGVCTSEYLAGSINTNPVVVRKIVGMLKKANLVEVRPGIAGTELVKELSEVTLFDVYKAVNVVNEKELFSIHDNPNPECPVGRNIQDTIEPFFIAAQVAMEEVLKSHTLKNIVQDIVTKEEMY
ncbi:DNA-binding transcriptional regulator, IscR family [Gracilibacillus ureilyticus]|uniref:DNA-binding transcriptional regulator, IscR family n=1 Tax=Gracilibacillus ureilyticus TaxID=531814 RepID=A0A1H9QRT1_9BACI|nr:Rrf2 family transcriptional regulator [Gracilibacillus ureilyticus]SER63172.1 DNA-binding transcriptional regulator, IscR family [Gracilibacillus ureilyticus]